MKHPLVVQHWRRTFSPSEKSNFFFVPIEAEKRNEDLRKRHGTVQKIMTNYDTCRAMGEIGIHVHSNCNVYSHRIPGLHQASFLF